MNQLNAHARTLAAALVLALAPVTAAAAQEADTAQSESREQTPILMRAEQVVAVINGEANAADIFTDGFLAAVPIAQLETISAQLTGQFGRALAVEAVNPPSGNRSALAIRMERAIARGGIAIDPADENRVSELLFQNFEPIDDTPEKIVADLSALPGSVSTWFGPLGEGEPVIAIEPDAQMPLGSTFKLYVLAALADEIASGTRDWDDVVTLGDTRSFPSGMMQDWPKDAPVTLHTLAAMMVSVSDNTATDALIAELGRDAVFEALVASGHSEPTRNAPFLTTREMFLLKGGPQERLAAYQSGDHDRREAILAQIETVPLDAAEIEAAFRQGPRALDIEWFASTADVVSLFRNFLDTGNEEALAIMAINPSITDNARHGWRYVGYKGGSEPGVLHLAWLLEDEAGQRHALVLGWKNEDANLEQSALEVIAQRILSLPR
ncbi:serine hydrolase [Qipengyuania nanhaisediminis]|uniref:serine hydrolase n=1 Tax=Qipengyuania nanhaisediminis TaxID=604088 RepID=UPI0038B2AC34